jgi:NCS1 family nucleobase:cation symporter-1
MRGLSAYVAGFLAALPFFVLPDLYMGPAARALGGVDLGWLVGLVISGAVYLWMSRSLDPASEARAIEWNSSFAIRCKPAPSSAATGEC